MEEETIMHIRHNRSWYLLAWVVFAVIYAYMLTMSFKYIGWTFLVKNKIPFILLWLIMIFLTYLLVKTGIYIYYIEEIAEKRRRKNGKGRK